MIDIGQIFISKTNYIFAYESWLDASDVSGSGFHPTSYTNIRSEANESWAVIVDYLREFNPNAKVFCVPPGEPILLLYKENDYFWQVLVGEKTGWIMPDKEMNLELLVCNENANK